MDQPRPDPNAFRPVSGLRSTHTQSVINSSAIRRRIVYRRSKALLDAEQEWPVNCGDGVTLLGHYSPRPAGSRGLVVLFHGWEGSSRSNYIVSVGGRLFERGFDVFRLNFRDHGETHHLNAGIFHSCRLDEVLRALKDIQTRLEARNWVLVGYSLGGNFALRAALAATDRGLSLRRLVAVSPVISPLNSLLAMESGPASYQDYYIQKWAKSLKLKQQYFPDNYDYDQWYKLAGLREKTRFMATRYYEFESLDQYFDGYSVAGDRLAALQVPTTILTSADDMVIPVNDFHDLPESDKIELLITRYGGHCAFLKNWKMDCFADDLILARM